MVNSNSDSNGVTIMPRVIPVALMCLRRNPPFSFIRVTFTTHGERQRTMRRNDNLQRKGKNRDQSSERVCVCVYLCVVVVHTFPLLIPANVASQRGVGQSCTLAPHTQVQAHMYILLAWELNKNSCAKHLSHSLVCFIVSPPLPAFLFQRCMCALTMTENRQLWPRQ